MVRSQHVRINHSERVHRLLGNKEQTTPNQSTCIIVAAQMHCLRPMRLVAIHASNCTTAPKLLQDRLYSVYFLFQFIYLLIIFCTYNNLIKQIKQENQWHSIDISLNAFSFNICDCGWSKFLWAFSRLAPHAEKTIV